MKCEKLLILLNFNIWVDAIFNIPFGKMGMEHKSFLSKPNYDRPLSQKHWWNSFNSELSKLLFSWNIILLKRKTDTQTIVIHTWVLGRHFLEKKQEILSVQGKQVLVFVASDKNLWLQVEIRILEHLYLLLCEFGNFLILKHFLMRLVVKWTNVILIL